MKGIRKYILERLILPNSSWIAKEIESKFPLNASINSKYSVLENILNKHKIFFIDTSDAIRLAVLPEDMLHLVTSPVMKKYSKILPGIDLAFLDNESIGPRHVYNAIYIVINNKFDKILDNIETEENISDFIDSLFYVLDHELIHKSQMRSIGNVEKSKKIVTANDGMQNYYSHHIEISPFAQMTIKELIKDGYNKEEILDFIKTTHNFIGVSSINDLISFSGKSGNEIESLDQDDLIELVTEYIMKKNKDLPVNYINYISVVKVSKPESFKKYLSLLYQYAEKL